MAGLAGIVVFVAGVITSAVETRLRVRENERLIKRLHEVDLLKLEAKQEQYTRDQAERYAGILLALSDLKSSVAVQTQKLSDFIIWTKKNNGKKDV